MIVLKWYYVVDLILDSIWVVLVFHYKLCAFRIDFSHHIFLFCFYLRIDKPNIQNNIIVISSFQTGLNELFSSTGFYFESKVIEGSHEKKKKKYVFKFLGFFSQNFYFWSGDIFLSPSYPINSVFQWQYVSIRFQVFDEAVFLLTIKMPIVTKLIKVVTCCEELSLINMHDIPTEWFCGVTWQIKWIYQPAENVSTWLLHKWNIGLKWVIGLVRENKYSTD